MPIKDKTKYPKNWKAISLRIREESGQRCEWCKKPNGQQMVVCPDGFWCLFDEKVWHGRSGQEVFIEEVGRPDPSWLNLDKQRAIVCVLTVAHLDHDPGNNQRSNLAALCQACHLNHDQQQHIASRKATRLAKSGQLVFEA